jgi:uncharacterized protein (DUF1684 family)
MIVLASISLLALGGPPQDTYIGQILKWRTQTEANLKRPEGWLTVAGLFWLSEGENTMGTKSGSRIALPIGSGATDQVGSITLKGKQATLNVLAGATVQVNGAPVTGSVALKSDAGGKPDTVQIGTISFRVIVRGKRTGIRLYDSNSRGMKEFSGCHWYPVNSSFRIKAKFTAYSPPKKVSILNVLGDTETVALPGYVEFSINGKACRLDAQDEGDTLFFNFKDITSGTLTYPPGRFLNIPKPVNGYVDLDFNKSVNPPCAFTAFATCPLPPKSNILNVRISAGELNRHPAK